MHKCSWATENAVLRRSKFYGYFGDFIVVILVVCCFIFGNSVRVVVIDPESYSVGSHPFLKEASSFATEEYKDTFVIHVPR